MSKALSLVRSEDDGFEIRELPRNSKHPKIIRRTPSGLQLGDETFIEMFDTEGRGK